MVAILSIRAQLFDEEEVDRCGLRLSGHETLKERDGMGRKLKRQNTRRVASDDFLQANIITTCLLFLSSCIGLTFDPPSPVNPSLIFVIRLSVALGFVISPLGVARACGPWRAGMRPAGVDARIKTSVARFSPSFFVELGHSPWDWGVLSGVWDGYDVIGAERVPIRKRCRSLDWNIYGHVTQERDIVC
ncbi:hypothetical protein BXZ70DRAFT_907650 [Cristinia sonorae]|uniref:Uncharacterized protein n=1 Tax=Cristinia sonorae TaxID=1940300 RepID=A0A8K0UPT0_9AGAR|nr:hypothetical protein BXZ70DRAFT_907650 [Cristinia sonorae]